MKAILIDDERLARAELRRLLREHPEVEIIGEATHVADAIEQVDRLEPDLLFLDIEMPGGTGFDVLETIERVPLVIFTTAYDAYAVKAFEVNALDYLLKPVEPERLLAALARAAARRASTEKRGQSPPGGFLERIFVRDGELCLVVDVRDVVLFESEGNYTRLHLEEQQPLLGRSLGYLEERLDPRTFFRANRRELVNLQQVQRIEPGPRAGLALLLRNNREIEMSRRQAQRFKQIMSP
jgi:two-component system LytT family response regulator